MRTKSFFNFNRKSNVDVTALTKSIYDFTKEQSCKKERSYRNTNALPELVIEGFDEEQIWQQLELQNEGEIAHFLSVISTVSSGSKKSVIPVSSRKPEPIQIENDNLDQEDEGMFDEKESENEDVEIESDSKKRKHHRKKPSIVDDKFFKLQELDEYLTKEEKKEKQGEDNAGSDDESVDLFNDVSEEEDGDNAEKKYIKYADFFDTPESENEQADESKNSDHDNSIRDSEERESEDEEFDLNEEDEEDETVKRVRFNLTNDSDETDSLENKANDKKDKEERMEEDVEPKEPKSTLEVRQERLLTRIKELEDEAISEKPWQLKGEVSGPSRPHNSLLEEFVVVDINTRPAPVITEETTMKLEDIIKQRVKDKAWDDVEKKFKPVETPLEYKKKLILNQEKSKESLSQIYEREYLKQKQALDPEDNEKKEETPQLHNEIRQTMRSLISKLDALSNYHYTPKMVRFVIIYIKNQSELK